MYRDDFVNRLRNEKQIWDFVVIGGGATGASVALDAAARGFSTVLLEQHDFGKGTSSRSTKLVHGGVRYLAQGDVKLVREALRERTRLRNHAPHVVKEMAFVVPCANWRERLWYGMGFKVYDWLAGKSGFRPSRRVSQRECLAAVPTLNPARAAGGVVYSDGQFDDSRLLINLLQTASEQGAAVVNYAKVERVLKNSTGHAIGIACRDLETDASMTVSGRCLINATGPFCDWVRQLDDPDSPPLVAASQGVHLVLPQRFLPGETAVIVPKTSDGRVIFMIPWHDRVLVGTTDTPIDQPVLEPRARQSEIEFLLKTAAEYLTVAPRPEDVLSVFTGIRPLVGSRSKTRTSKLSRDHHIEVSESGMVTITGGKWTTARKMGEVCIDQAIQWAGLESRPCCTANLALHGAPAGETDKSPDSVYGTDAAKINRLTDSDPGLAHCIENAQGLRGADVAWAVRYEMARTVEDVLARRCRLLFLDAQAAAAAAPPVAEIMANELGRDPTWQATQVEQFHQLASQYQL